MSKRRKTRLTRQVNPIHTSCPRALKVGSIEAPEAFHVLQESFSAMIRELMKTTDRTDANVSNLRNAAYEAVMELIKNSPTVPFYRFALAPSMTLGRVFTGLLHHRARHAASGAEEAAAAPAAGEQRALGLGRVAAAWPAVATVCHAAECAGQDATARRAQGRRRGDGGAAADHVARHQQAGRHGDGGRADGLLGTRNWSVTPPHPHLPSSAEHMLAVLGEDFLKYMDHLKLFVVASLRNHAEHQVCQAAVGLVADMCRCLDRLFVPFVDEFMALLLEILSVLRVAGVLARGVAQPCPFQDMSMDKAVKPQVVAVFGDLALSVGPYFFKYLDTVLPTLHQAATVEVDPVGPPPRPEAARHLHTYLFQGDFDAVDYQSQLRESCLEAYTGILQGFRGDSATITSERWRQSASCYLRLTDVADELERIQPHIAQMVAFLDRVAADRSQPDGVLAAAVGLIGWAAAFGSVRLKWLPPLQRPALGLWCEHPEGDRPRPDQRAAAEGAARQERQDEDAGHVGHQGAEEAEDAVCLAQTGEAYSRFNAGSAQLRNSDTARTIPAPPAARKPPRVPPRAPAEWSSARLVDWLALDACRAERGNAAACPCPRALPHLTASETACMIGWLTRRASDIHVCCSFHLLRFKSLRLASLPPMGVKGGAFPP